MAKEDVNLDDFIDEQLSGEPINASVRIAKELERSKLTRIIFGFLTTSFIIMSGFWLLNDTALFRYLGVGEKSTPKPYNEQIETLESMQDTFESFKKEIDNLNNFIETQKSQLTEEESLIQMLRGQNEELKGQHEELKAFFEIDQKKMQEFLDFYEKNKDSKFDWVGKLIGFVTGIITSFIASILHQVYRSRYRKKH